MGQVMNLNSGKENIRENFPIARNVEHGNRLPGKVRQSCGIAGHKKRLNLFL